MSADVPEPPDMGDDLVQAYARAQALADGDRGPSATARANVLAAAREVAAEAAARVAAEAAAPPPLTPVAPPVADVGRGRSKAINLSAWRVRSGAALAVVLLAGVAGWRFDAARRLNDGEQVATAERRMATPPTSQMPRELPVPAMSGASNQYVPPAVADDAADGGRRPTATHAARDREVIVAQLDRRDDRRARAAAPPAAMSPARQLQPPAAPAPNVADSANPAPVALASNAPEAKALASEPGQERADVDASRAAYASAGVGGAMKKSAPNAVGSLVAASARMLPAPLHAAADRGDVETLKRLLANPSTPVDAPDSTGRTALLHAVQAQQPAAVRLLLAAGADPARADQAGLTPRAAAQAGANAEIAALLSAPR